MEYLIELENVYVASEDVEILKNICLKIPRGKSTVIVGHSGCGKSTLLKTLAGIYIPERGSLLFGGQEFGKYSEKELKVIRKQNGFVFQDAALWANMSMYQNLALPMEYHYKELSAQEIQKRIAILLEETKMKGQENLRPAQLSIGETKIISFLRAYVSEPDLLFMDEPTLSVDKEIVQVLYRIILDLKKKGCTLITVTHDPELTSRLADYIVVLRYGEVVEWGDFPTISRSENHYTRAVLSYVLKDAANYDKNLLDLLENDYGEKER